jgi:hypothetical protein
VNQQLLIAASDFFNKIRPKQSYLGREIRMMLESPTLRFEVGREGDRADRVWAEIAFDQRVQQKKAESGPIACLACEGR